MHLKKKKKWLHQDRKYFYMKKQQQLHSDQLNPDFQSYLSAMIS